MSNILDQIKAKKEAAEVTETTKVVETPAEEKAIEKTFNVYKASMQSFKMVRPDGKVIHIIGGKLITDDEADIEYVDAEIKAGFPYLRPAEHITTEELDPMAGLKAQMKEEARKELLAERVAELQDLGSTEQQEVKPASTVDLGAINAGSNSPAS